MVRTSGIREKLRSNVLKELAKERGTKRTRHDDNDDDKHHQEGADGDTIVADTSNQERRMKKAKEAKSGLLSLLPEPKNSSAFGPTIRLDKLLKMPDRADNVELQAHQDDARGHAVNQDGMIEVDISKVISDGTSTTAATSAIRDLTIEKAQPGTVILPRGKEKQKNQITYLAKLGQATELERKEQAAQGQMNKSAARSKYGW